MKKTLLASLLTVFLAAVVFSAGVQEEKETEKIAEFTVEIRHCNT